MLSQTITVSQPKTVAWSRDGYTEPIDFMLLYLDQSSRPTATQILAIDTVRPIGSDSLMHGTVTFTPTAPGNVEFRASKLVYTHDKAGYGVQLGELSEARVVDLPNFLFSSTTTAGRGGHLATMLVAAAVSPPPSSDQGSLPT
ncbi:hypothetical protein PM082_018465 [Marasmius tenuissimus]|nr:hypothetical protein PM082_018465 [Marasmius tenuissimus]